MPNGRPILILRHIAFEGPGVLGELMDARGLGSVFLDPGEGTAWPDPAAFAAVVAMGGPQSVYDEAQWPWLAPENAFIQACLKAGLPFLGVCLGSQLLAKALGARCYPNPSGKEIGWGEVSLCPDAALEPMFAGMPERFMAFHWHGDTFDVPAGCRRLARTALTPNQAFSWRDQAWGLQFHLEVGPEDIRTWIREYQEEAKVHLPGDVETDIRRHCEAYRQYGERLFGYFLRKAGERR
jgi:GMP synthase (glutamine-hydrolysing)